MKFRLLSVRSSVSVAVGALLLATSGAYAAPITYNDRAEFAVASGPLQIETFNSFTSDVDLASAVTVGEVTLQNVRANGALGDSKIDAAPFVGASSVNGTTYVQSRLYDVANIYSSFLTLTFNSAITAFGANMISGGGGVFFVVDGTAFEGNVSNGGFLGFKSDTPFSRVEIHARPGSSYVAQFDDLTFSATAVPEPAAWGAMLLGLAAIGAGRARRRSALRIG